MAVSRALRGADGEPSAHSLSELAGWISPAWSPRWRRRACTRLIYLLPSTPSLLRWLAVVPRPAPSRRWQIAIEVRLRSCFSVALQSMVADPLLMARSPSLHHTLLLASPPSSLAVSVAAPARLPRPPTLLLGPFQRLHALFDRVLAGSSSP